MGTDEGHRRAVGHRPVVREGQSGILLGATLLAVLAAVAVGGIFDVLNRSLLHRHVFPAAIIGFAVGLVAAGALVVRSRR